ncbi:predicted GPI-anchored protein 58 [Zingiber officinale]|uniref:predicted GPI-anchored protein 58 n=1 Tax=Zingiber officinale TaxID=94328 RepID=UPI001C4D2A55|nr:predicted GPI-anchored protein 58 [Zingiber officinale]
MEIMRRGRVILQRRALPHGSSTSIGGASRAHPPPRPARRGSSVVLPAPLACPTRLRTARPPRPAAPARPRATRPPRPAAPACPRVARPPKPTALTLLHTVSSPRATYIPGRGLGERLMGLGGGTGNISFASPAFREASQAARRARAINERLSQDTPSPSRRRARSPSDDQPLAQRCRRRAPRPVSDSGPSSTPSPPPNVAASHPPPIPSPVNNPPISSDTQVEPQLAPPFTLQQTQGDEAGPSAPPSSTAGPSDPSQLTYHSYCTSIPSEGRLRSRTDVPTSYLNMKGRLTSVWEESMQHMDSLPPPAQMDKFA